MDKQLILSYCDLYAACLRDESRTVGHADSVSFPRTEDEVRQIATSLLMISGITLPMHSLVHGIYFAVRSGGKTFITFLFDSVYTWLVPAMLALYLCKCTPLDIVPIYLIVQLSDALKMTIGLLMLKSGFWANTVITTEKA